MKLARSLERRLERAVEGLSGKVFRGSLQPLELATRLARQLDLNVANGPLGPAVPNYFVVEVSVRDLSEADPELAARLGEVIESTAAENGWRLEGSGKVEIAVVDDLSAGTTRFQPSVRPGPRPAWAYLRGSDSRLALRYNRGLVGRGADADVAVGTAETSRRHALIWRESGQAWIADLGSSNGTFLDGDSIEAAPLSTGARVGIGLTEFIFEAD